MLQDLDPLEDGRALATAASTLALEIDPHCYRAAQIQTRLIREDGYRDKDAFERAIELMLSSDRPVLQADAYGERAAHLSIFEDDPYAAYEQHDLFSKVFPLSPRHASNGWFFSVILADKRHRKDLLREFSRAVHRRARTSAARAWWLRTCQSVLTAGHEDGLLTSAHFRGCRDRLQKVLSEE